MLPGRVRSFGHALTGWRTLIAEQTNARIHLLATAVVICLGWWQSLQDWEWVAILLCIALVWCAEALNTALEYLCDLVQPEPDPLVKRAKDVAAGGVLVCAVIALIVAAIIFSP
jgi:diacylglycerol kinase